MTDLQKYLHAHLSENHQHQLRMIIAVLVALNLEEGTKAIDTEEEYINLNANWSAFAQNRIMNSDYAIQKFYLAVAGGIRYWSARENFMFALNEEVAEQLKALLAAWSSDKKADELPTATERIRNAIDAKVRAIHEVALLSHKEKDGLALAIHTQRIKALLSVFEMGFGESGADYLKTLLGPENAEFIQRYSFNLETAESISKEWSSKIQYFQSGVVSPEIKDELLALKSGKIRAEKMQPYIFDAKQLQEILQSVVHPNLMAEDDESKTEVQAMLDELRSIIQRTATRIRIHSGTKKLGEAFRASGVSISPEANNVQVGIDTGSKEQPAPNTAKVESVPVSQPIFLAEEIRKTLNKVLNPLLFNTTSALKGEITLLREELLDALNSNSRELQISQELLDHSAYRILFTLATVLLEVPLLQSLPNGEDRFTMWDIHKIACGLPRYVSDSELESLKYTLHNRAQSIKDLSNLSKRQCASSPFTIQIPPIDKDVQDKLKATLQRIKECPPAISISELNSALSKLTAQSGASADPSLKVVGTTAQTAYVSEGNPSLFDRYGWLCAELAKMSYRDRMIMPRIHNDILFIRVGAPGDIGYDEGLDAGLYAAECCVDNIYSEYELLLAVQDTLLDYERKNIRRELTYTGIEPLHPDIHLHAILNAAEETL